MRLRTSCASFAVLALLASTPAPADAADRDKLHKSMQGRWRADKQTLAEGSPTWKTMTAEQRTELLGMMPDMNFEFTATRMTLLASGQDDKDQPMDYQIVGSEGNTLRLKGKTPDASSEETLNVEVVDEQTLKLSKDGDPQVIVLKRATATAKKP